MTVLNTLKTRIAKLIEAIDPDLRRQRQDEAYLAEATDRIDLELRQRSLDHERGRRYQTVSHNRFG